MRVRLTILTAAGVLLAVAGCTSSSSGGASTPPPRPSAPRSSRSTPTAPTVSATSAARSALAALRGAVLLSGPSVGDADAYQVTASGLERLTTGAKLTSVTADSKRIVVATARRISELHGHTLRGLGSAAAFSPALSSSDTLATVALDLANRTPGITKPEAFVLRVANPPATAARTVLQTTSSLGRPVWLNDRTLLITSSQGTRTSILRIPTTGAASSTVATIPGSDALDLTVGSRWIATTGGERSMLLPITGGAVHPLPAGVAPLCWTRPGTLVAMVGARLVASTISADGTVSTSRTLIALGHRHVYGADCSRVAG